MKLCLTFIRSAERRAITYAVMLAVLTFQVFGFPAFAQIISGRLTGTVSDTSGAAVVDAVVTVTNIDTHIATIAHTGKAGTYVFEALNPGRYALQAVRDGFKTYNAPDVEIHIQQDTLADVILQLGTATESVTVTAAAPLLQAEDASIGQTVNSQQIDSLPLNGRDWVSLGQLAAGVTTTTTALGGNTSSPFFAVNGINFWQNDFRLNGIDNNIEMYGGSQVGTNASITPPPDAIQEFRLQSGDYSAEFGHSTGAVVNAVVRSGGNQVHGALWEYLRNDAFDANDYFSNQNGIPKPEYRQNQYGGTIGGPVVIPHLYDGRNRTFFFFDFQGLRIVQPTNATSTVPTAGMLSSSFTNLQDLISYNAGTREDSLNRTFPLGTVFDPATTRTVAAGAIDPESGIVNTTGAAVSVRDPFYTGGSIFGVTDFTTRTASLNQLPMARLDPNAIKLLQLYPNPTSAGFANNYYLSAKGTQDMNQVDLRIDQTFGGKDTLFGAYDWSHEMVYQPGALPGYADGQVYGSGYTDAPHYMVSIGYTHVFTPSLTNEFHFGYTHNYLANTAVQGNTPGIPEQFGIQGIGNYPGNGGLPIFSISGLTGLGVPYYTPTLSTIRSLEFMDSVTKVHGRQTIKAGYQFNSIRGDLTQPAYGRGAFNYTGQFSSVPNNNGGVTGLADLLLVPSPSTVPDGIDNVGGVSSFQGSNYATPKNQRYYMGAYFQDDWKITPKLTANMGLRWDYTTLAAETSGHQANFVADGGNGPSGTYYIPNQACNTPRSSSFNTLAAQDGIAIQCTGKLSTGNVQLDNFAPRLGISYRLLNNLVARAGYGIAFGALANGLAGQVLTYNYPFQYTISQSSPDSSNPLVLPNGQTATMENSLQQINLQDPTQLSPATGTSLAGIQYNFQSPYTQTFNTTLQWQFDKSDAIQLAYVGSRGKHLDVLGSNNSPSQILPPGANLYAYIPFPDFAPDSEYGTTNGSSQYDSMQVVYARQMAKGLSVAANYTFSKCFSNQSALSGGFPGYRAEWLPGFGIRNDVMLCDTDSRHVIHASGTYEIPVGNGRQFLNRGNRILDLAAGGWSFNYIFTHQAGQPFTVSCPTQTNAFFGCFANVVPSENIYAGPHDQRQWLNPAAFANPPVATASQTSYAVLGGDGMQSHGPALNNLDASLFKDFSLHEKVHLQFRAEAFNLANTPQFNNPGNLDFTNTTSFSQISSLRGTPRILQFALKLYY